MMRAAPVLMLVLMSALVSSLGAGCVEGTLSPLEDADDAAPDQSIGDMAGPTPDMSQPAVVCPAGQTACGLLCVDLMSDPTSCGQCGRTCVLPHAEAACVAGECAIGRCDAGTFDVDKLLDNGCESMDSCASQVPCETQCGSMGQTSCVNGVTSCVAQAEVCNAVDDDCNGQCDEGAIGGCRRAIHRGFSGGGHMFNDDLGAFDAVESQSFFHLYPTAPQGISGGGFKPVFLCNKPNNKKFLTSDLECERAGGMIKQLGFWAAMPVCGSTPLYRVFSEAEQNHFYTTSAPERDNATANLGYRDEGIAGHVWPAL